MLIPACLALTGGKLIAGLAVQDQSTAAARHDGYAFPNEGKGDE